MADTGLVAQVLVGAIVLISVARIWDRLRR
jgi:hypothetical protein